MSDRQHAIAAHLEIVTHHPRTFLGRVEVAALDRVVEEDRVGVPQAVVAVVVTMMRASACWHRRRGTSLQAQELPRQSLAPVLAV